MEKIYLEYLKTNTFEEEVEIEQFWLDIRKDLFSLEEDNSLIYYNIRRGHASAYSGEYAGIFLQVLITIITLTDATLSIWDKISNHIKERNEKGKIVRVLNLVLLENLCKYDLIINKGINDGHHIKSEKLVDRDIKGYDLDLDFPYEETLHKVDCAKITFKNKKFQFTYIIASNGEITFFERSENNIADNR